MSDERHWRKSSHSSGDSNCVEVALARPIGIRDTKDRHRELAVSAAAFAALLSRHR